MVFIFIIVIFRLQFVMALLTHQIYAGVTEGRRSTVQLNVAEQQQSGNAIGRAQSQTSLLGESDQRMRVASCLWSAKLS